LIMCTAMAVVNLICVVAFGTPATLRLFRLAVVNSAGEPASRFLQILRTVALALIWIPVWLAAAALILVPTVLLPVLYRTQAEFDQMAIVFPATAIVFVAGLFWNVVRPSRGPHDFVAGTHLVPC